MDRQTTFLLALGMLIAASLVVSASGWVLWARDRALRRTEVRSAAADVREPSPKEGPAA